MKVNSLVITKYTTHKGLNVVHLFITHFINQFFFAQVFLHSYTYSIQIILTATFSLGFTLFI